jgi:hypothetical protein
MDDSGLNLKIGQGLTVDIQSLFPNCSSLKVVVRGTGESLHIEEFEMTVIFLEPLYNYSEPHCSVEIIPPASKLYKAEVGLEYIEECSSDFDDLWVTATFWFWCKHTNEPVHIVHIHCVQATNLEVIETTIPPPVNVIIH